MSQKLPVGDVLNEAVQFGLHRWGTILRFGWLPMLLSMVVVMAYIIVAFGAAVFTVEEGQSDLETLKSAMRFSVPVAIVLGVAAYAFVIFLFCGVAASVFRLVALGEERPGIFQLRMDGATARVFWAYVIIMVISSVIWGVAFTVGLGMAGETWGGLFSGFMRFIELAEAADTGESTDLEAFSALMGPLKAVGLASLIAAIPAIYVGVKLSPFPAGSAVENRLLLFGSFAMTFGHFWSIVGIFILLFIFMMVVGIIYQLALTIFQMLAVLLATQGAALAFVSGIIFVGILAASIFYQLFITALQLSVPAIIYRRLKTGE